MIIIIIIEYECVHYDYYQKQANDELKKTVEANKCDQDV